MAKHVIFVVHGMGDFKEDWGGGVAKLLKQLYERYEIATLLPFDEQFVVRPLFYNDRFDKLRSDWETAAKAVLGKMSFAGNLSALKKVTEWTESANKKDFLRTHILDVVLYRFVPTVADAVRARIRKQILEGIKDADTWSVIGHSLGTSVLHDALVWMFDPASPEAIEPEKFRFQTLAMVANVSRVLEQTEYGPIWDVYRSVVHPDVDRTRGVCNRFLNVWHTWDPIPVPKKFKALPDWPDRQTRQLPEAFQDIRIEELEAADKVTAVHDIEHYLRNPKFHIALFRSLMPMGGVISAAEEKQARDEHTAANPISRVRKQLERLKDFRMSDEEENWGVILAKLHEFLREAL